MTEPIGICIQRRYKSSEICARSTLVATTVCKGLYPGMQNTGIYTDCFSYLYALSMLPFATSEGLDTISTLTTEIHTRRSDEMVAEWMVQYGVVTEQCAKIN